MKLKTKQELMNDGFIYVSTNANNDMEVWAKFTGYEDYIQYIDFKEGVYTGDVQVISFGKLILFEEMYKKMMNYPKFNQNDYLGKVSEKWINKSK